MARRSGSAAGQAGAGTCGESALVQQACHRQVLQGQPGHVKQGDVGVRTLHLYLVREHVAKRCGLGVWRPLQLANLTGLRQVIYKKAGPGQQSGRQLPFAAGVGTNACQVRAGLHRFQRKQRTGTRGGRDHHVTVRHGRITIGGMGDDAGWKGLGDGGLKVWPGPAA